MRRALCVGLLIAGASGAIGCASSTALPSASAPPAPAEVTPALVIQAYAEGLSHVHAANSKVQLGVAHDPEQGDGPVLLVQYPAPTDDPAGRDVNCDAETQDWSSGSALSFQIKPAHALKLSVSFLDRNRVAYTTWTKLEAGVWQPVRISFAEMQPNPYFQPPDAKKGAPMDVREVKGIAFAPHDETSGSFAVSKFVVLR
jgi:hypothetical protein